ncbi:MULTISPECIES: hypothetical protein [unclassified Ensifer]|uniref:hypothetical protein n=1 Tax=unclassified Ensifer TaxID=2633371 RepID=UPI0008134EF5|nr:MULTISPECIES: hypothetical protein [unclassified Ensifer]OCP17367.1 hypothetical protein BC361_07860 [Ensifer sp. LC54]OCP28728.1 hypothetical protein BC363_02500 [Ensifer sp. LC384]
MTLPHTTGTITLTNGSTLITGTGTDWQTAGIVGGMVFPLANGNVLPIAAVNSNTQMVAAVPWTGATVSTQYALVRDTAYLQQLTENAALLTTVIRELRYSSLAALAALAPTMAVDKLPFATSANAMAWTPFTAYGRQLVAVTTDAGFASAAKVVRRTGGTNMTSTNDVMVGWHSALGGLIGQVDAVYLGNIWTDYYASNMGGAADIRSRIGAFSTGGGTISGNVTVTGIVNSQTGVFAPFFYNVGAANTDGAFYFQSGTVGGATSNRWAWVRAGYGVGEPGGNVGSDMKLMRWSDANVYLGTSFIAERKTGAVYLPDTPLMCTSLGPDVFVAAGGMIGVANGGFTFNRGGFAIGGAINGRNAVHVPLAGWYLVDVFVAGGIAGGGEIAIDLSRNGTSTQGALVMRGGYVTGSLSALVNMGANDWFAYNIMTSGFTFTGWNSRITVQWMHP